MTILFYFLIIIVPIVLLSIGLKYWMRYASKKEEGEEESRHKLVAYIYQYSGALKSIGFITALLFCIALWNYRYEFKVVIEAEKQKELIMDIFDMAINTEQKKPPKPKPILTPKIIETPEEEIEEEKEPDFAEEPADEPDPTQGLEGDEDGEEEEEFEDNTIFYGAEISEIASFPNFNAYIARNFVTPLIDKKTGTRGKIYVSFVVEKDGRITNVVVKRGLTKTLNSEAVKLLRNMPKWTPGYNHGNAVRSTYMKTFNIK